MVVTDVVDNASDVDFARPTLTILAAQGSVNGMSAALSSTVSSQFHLITQEMRQQKQDKNKT